MHCSRTRKFKIELMIHTTRIQTIHKYTGDVVMMGLCASNCGDVLRWLIDDSPQTPKTVITDTKAKSDPFTIQSKFWAVRSAYLIDEVPVLGSIGIMILHALMESTETPLPTFSP